MGSVKYKSISNSLEKLTKPDELRGRFSIGLEKSIGEYHQIDVNDLLPFKNQARKHFPAENIESLAQSIKEHGVRHPLTVIAYEGEKGKYEVVSGERRLRAAKLIGLKKIPCILLYNRIVAEEIAIVENVHREDLHPIELGNALESLLQNGIFNSQEEISSKLAISKSSVSEYLSFATLDKDIKDRLIKHNITSRDKLRKLLKCSNNKEDVEKVFKSKSELTTNFSVIRIFCNDDILVTQHNGINKLDSEKKRELKLKLIEITASL